MVEFEYGIRGKLLGYVSTEDVDLIAFRWGKSNKYAQGTQGQNAGMLLHREVMARVLGRKLEAHEWVDHIDGNRGNNCRSNLRLATNAQNQANRGPSKRSTTGFKGVYPDPSRINPFRAILRHNGKNINLGSYPTAELAKQAYNAKALEIFGEYSKP